MPGITGVEYVPGEYESKTSDIIGVILWGVPKDDGNFLSLFLHELNESSGEYAILLGDLSLDLDLDLAWSLYGSCLEVEASGVEVLD